MTATVDSGKRGLSVKTKLMLIVVATSFLGLLVASIALVSYDRYSATESLVQEVEVLGRVIADRSNAALVFRDEALARENLEALTASSPIQAACLYEATGTLFTSYLRTPAPEYRCPPAPPDSGQRIRGERLEVVQSVGLDGNHIGVLYLVSSLEAVNRRLIRYLTSVAIVVPLALLIALLASTRLQKVISAPLLNLADIARRIAKDKNYSLRADKMSSDEVGVLVDAFNEMLEEIGQSEQARKQHVEQLQFQANHDSLTGLPNRYHLSKELTAALARAEEHGTTLMVALMDLDRFKEINDTLGHPFGDEVLRRISEILRDALEGTGAPLARLGGDEFAILFPENTRVENGLQLLRRLLAQMRSPLALQGVTVEVGASIGVALFPDHGRDQSTLMRRADIAMYQAKSGSSGYAVYAPEHDQFSPRRLELITDLASAIRENQLTLVYQPKIELHSGRISGVEALVRWTHPRHGAIPPSQFIPLAEMGDTIHALTYCVMDQALRQARIWNSHGVLTRVAINLSARDLANPHCVHAIEELMAKHQVRSEWLEMEITETAIMTEVRRALLTLQRIHELGIRLTVDDFGTGYSSLVHLRELPISALKVDLSFVVNMVHNPPDQIIVKSIIDLAHNLGLGVIAEGVENPDTLQALRAVECDEVQGYLIAQPLDREEVTRWMAAKNRAAMPNA